MDQNYDANYVIPIAGFIIAVLQLYITGRFTNIKTLIDNLRKDLDKLEFKFDACKDKHEGEVENIREKIARLDISTHRGDD
ncbi:hypothetical protein CCP1ISM_1290002 [Azospirillaceae bacterium]